MNDWFNPNHRLWATLTLLASVIWLFFSVIPGGIFTTALGVPFAIFAFIAGWLTYQAAHQQADSSGKRRVGIGLGISCLGCLWQIVYYLFWMVVLFGGAGVFINSFKGTPTP